MASCAKQTHPSHHLFLLALLMSSFPLLKLGVKADEEMMKQECHNADVPTVCLQCLQSDPTSLTADRAGIASIIISCLDSRLDALSSNVSSLASEEKHNATKTALKDCEKGFLQAKKDLSSAQKGLSTGDYDEAEQSVRGALENPLACEAVLKDVSLQDPSNLTYQMKVYEELTNAAMRIIDRL